jgi:hypothetical protein
MKILHYSSRLREQLLNKFHQSPTVQSKVVAGGSAGNALQHGMSTAKFAFHDKEKPTSLA